MATIRDLITRHLRLIEEVGAGQTATAEDAADGLVSLNAMLDSWSIQGDLVYTETQESFTLTANDGQYTIGPTGDFVTARPTKIISAIISDGITDYELEQYSAAQWAAITDKTIQGYPEVIYFDGNYPNSTIYLSPRPAQNYTLKLFCEKPLSTYTSINDTFVGPPGYEDAVVYNLSVRRAPEYGKEAAQTVKNIARESKNAIMGQNNRIDNDKMTVDDALMSEGGFDIFTGRYR